MPVNPETSGSAARVHGLLRTHFWRIAIGVILSVAVYAALCVWMSYRRENQILIEIRDLEGRQGLEGMIYVTKTSPAWVPGAIKQHVPYFDRVEMVEVAPTEDAQIDAILERIGGLPNLRVLEVGYPTRLDDKSLEHVRHLSNLEFLELPGTQVSQLGALRELVSLAGLDVSRTPVNDDGLANLQGLSNLEVLNLSRTQITDAGMRHLKGLVNLQEIYLDETGIGDAGLMHLQGLTKLRVLDLNQTDVSGTGLAHLALMTNLKVISLDKSPVRDDGLKHLKPFTNLEWLTLSGTHISDTGLEQICHCRQIRLLNLRDTLVSNTGFPCINQLANLTALDVSGTRVTDTAFRHLKGLTHLATIRLYPNQITPEGRAILHDLLPDCSIHVVDK